MEHIIRNKTRMSLTVISLFVWLTVLNSSFLHAECNSGGGFLGFLSALSVGPAEALVGAAAGSGVIAGDCGILPGLDLNISMDEDTLRRLQEAMATARINLDLAISHAAGETRETLTHAREELSTLAAELNSYVGLRIADLDSRIIAKLTWMDAYTAQVNLYALGLINTVSTEAQRLAGVIGEEARLTVGMFGSEVRGIVSTARDSAMQVVTEISAESQALVRQISLSLTQLMEQARQFIAEIDESVVVIVNGTIYLIDLVTDRLLTIFGVVLGIVFLFVASKSWGLGILSHHLPKPGRTRILIQVLMAMSFIAALLPFALVVQPVRAVVMVSVNGAQPFSERSVKPRIWNIDPLPLIYSADRQPEFGCPYADFATCVVVEGANMAANGLATAYAGSAQLRTVANDDVIVVDMSAAAINTSESQVTIRFGDAADAPTFSIPFWRRAPGEVSPQWVPTTTPTPQNTATILNESGVNIRVGPGNQQIITRAAAGQTYEVIARYPNANPEWYQIKFVDSVGQPLEGWITGDPRWVQINFQTTITVLDEGDGVTFVNFETPVPPTSTSTVNLVIGNFTFNPSSPRCGQVLTVLVDVANLGASPAPQTTLRIQDFRLTDNAFQTEGNAVVPALQPGQTARRLQVQLSLVNSHSQQHRLVMTVDPNGQVAETTEADNTRNADFRLERGSCP